MCNLLNCYLNRTNVKSDFIFDNYKYLQYLILFTWYNLFWCEKKFLNVKGDFINFEFIEKLNNIQEQERLYLGTKLRKQPMHFLKQKMKVGWQQGCSVSETFFYCKDKPQLKKFRDCGPTADFILLMKNAFEILNSHKISHFDFKQAACSNNKKILEYFLIISICILMFKIFRWIAYFIISEKVWVS